MGNQMFRYLESGMVSDSENQIADGDSNVQILYSADEDDEYIELQAPEVTRQTTETTQDQPPAVESEIERQVLQFDPDGPAWFAYSAPSGTINVRSGPGTSNTALFRVAQGTRGRVIDRRDGWTKIRWDFNREEGWVRDDLLLQGPASVISNMVHQAGGVENLDEEQIKQASIIQHQRDSKIAVATAKPAPVEDTVENLIDVDNLPSQAIITADPMANIRIGPGTQHERTGRLPKGVTVEIGGVEQVGRWKWFKIIYSDGQRTGWTREDNLRFQ